MMNDLPKFTMVTVSKMDLGSNSIVQHLHGKKIQADFISASKKDSLLYTEEDLCEIYKGVEDSDIVGVSSISMSEERAFQLIEYIKKRDSSKHVSIGGPAAMLRPEYVLRNSLADSLCIHEGELPVENLLKTYFSGDYRHVKGMWFKDKEKVIKNLPQRPLQSLDGLDFSDISSGEFGQVSRLVGSSLVVDEGLVRGKINPFTQGEILFIMAMRGCLGDCSYCINDKLNGLNKGIGSKRLRKKSIGSLIADLEKAKKRGGIERIFFFDDDFFSRPLKEIEFFSYEYSKKIKLPFFVYGGPKTTTKRKLDYMVDAGMQVLNIAFQSGSAKVLEKYNRPNHLEETKALMGYIASQNYNFEVWVDVLTNSPFETGVDIEKTVDYILDLPGRFMLHVHNLHLYPGNKLREEFGSGTGREVTEYQNSNLLKGEMFNEYWTKLLLSMQGWVQNGNYGALMREEVLKYKNVSAEEKESFLLILNEKIRETMAAKYYEENDK